MEYFFDQIIIKQKAKFGHHSIVAGVAENGIPRTVSLSIN